MGEPIFHSASSAFGKSSGFIFIVYNTKPIANNQAEIAIG